MGPQAVVIHIAAGVAACMLMLFSYGLSERMRIEHLQMLDEQRQLEISVARLARNREASQLEAELMKAARKSGLAYVDFSDRQVELVGKPLARERINQVLQDNLSDPEGFFLVEAFALESGSAQEGLFDGGRSEGAGQPVLTLKGRQVFRK